MIYRRLKNALLDLLKAPTEPPPPPAGSRGSVRVFRAAPNFLKYQILVWGSGFAAGIVGEAIFLALEIRAAQREEGQSAEIAFAAALLVLTLAGAVVKYFLIRLDYDMRYYVVTDRSLRIREGALLIRESTFTFANVQNLRITQGPLERLLGLANLVVETAGGSAKSSEERENNLFAALFGGGHQGALRGIGDAREIRDEMLVLLRRYRDAGLGDPEDRGGAAPARGPGLPPAAIERLREIREEARGLRAALR